MALISDVVGAVAEAEDLPEATVALAARYAREAGYLSQGARGRNAPHANVADVANILIAVNASGCIVKEAPAAIETYRRLRIHVPHGARSDREASTVYTAINHDELKFLNRGQALFGEALESIIERFIGGELEVFMRNEACKYLDDDYIEKLVDAHPGDPRAIAERVINVADQMLRLNAVSFTVRFYRPTPFVRLSVERAMGANSETLAGASFMATPDDLQAGRIKLGAGDRRDETVIGYRTFMKVAEVMRR